MKSPAIQSEGEADTAARASIESSPPEAAEGLQELLIDELRDILHAEKQLTKALPKMVEAARFDQLRELFEQHLIETENQIERVNECFSLLGETARAKPCKGMMGLIEEDQEVIEGREERGRRGGPCPYQCGPAGGALRNLGIYECSQSRFATSA